MNKGVEFASKDSTQMNPAQADVLRLYTEEFLTIKEIAYRRQTSLQAVYKTIKKLKAKGIISTGNQGGLKKKQPTLKIQPPTDKLRNGIRLHGQEFNCKIIFKGSKYDRLLKTKNIFYMDNHTIRLFQNSLEIYAGESCSFMGEDEQRATALSFQYWNKFFTKLENRLNIILIKSENTKIRQVNAHYAEINNELAKDCNQKKVKINIYGLEDGKIWFKIDNSWQLHEAETLHPAQSKHDMSRVKQVFNEFRNEMCMSPMEMTVSLGRMARGMEMFGENFESHVDAIQKLGKGVEELTEVVKELKRNGI